MTTRTTAPVGAPCWTDLWTSDVEGSRRFYGELFGWEANEPSPEFGGYFMFTRDGVPIAGGMGDMPDNPAQNIWQIYLATDDITKTLDAAATDGAQIISPAMAVADLGSQGILLDPTGAHLGTWQPETFPGFTVLNEPGSPSWFELHTRDFARAVAFYRSVFRWETDEEPAGQIAYAMMRDPAGGGHLAGIMDASTFLPEGMPAHWSVYWEVDDARAAVTRAKALGASVVMECEDTPYGTLAALRDPAGAPFKLRTTPA